LGGTKNGLNVSISKSKIYILLTFHCLGAAEKENPVNTRVAEFAAEGISIMVHHHFLASVAKAKKWRGDRSEGTSPRF
jgi:hypothetical protein